MCVCATLCVCVFVCVSVCLSVFACVHCPKHRRRSGKVGKDKLRLNQNNAISRQNWERRNGMSCPFRLNRKAEKQSHLLLCWTVEADVRRRYGTEYILTVMKLNPLYTRCLINLSNELFVHTKCSPRDNRLFARALTSGIARSEINNSTGKVRNEKCYRCWLWLQIFNGRTMKACVACFST